MVECSEYTPYTVRDISLNTRPDRMRTLRGVVRELLADVYLGNLSGRRYSASVQTNEQGAIHAPKSSILAHIQALTGQYRQCSRLRSPLLAQCQIIGRVF